MSEARSPRRATLLVGAAVLAVLGGALLVNLLKPRDFYTGTNSVVGKNVAVGVMRDVPLCVRGLDLPAGTGAIRVEVQAGVGRPRTRIAAEVRPRGEPLIRTRTAAIGPLRGSFDMPIPERPSSPRSVKATVCLTPERGDLFVFGVAGQQTDDVSPTLGGASIQARVAMWFLPPKGEQRSVLAQFPEIARRASVLRPAFVGAWTYWALVFAGLPLVLGAAGWLAWRALTRRPPRRAALVVLGLVFLNGAAWALITPSFDGPDEQDHYAYLQGLAENGKRPSPAVVQQRSDEEGAAVDATRILGHIEDGRGRPPWLPADEARFQRSLDALGGSPDRGDGGGVSTAATHAPVYYGLAVPAYWLASGDSVFGRVFAGRLVSAALGALLALFALLAVRELAPREEGLAVAAGLLVGFQPMVGFMSGVVNNDMAVNAACAAAVWLLLRGLRRGLTVRLGVALGLVLVFAPLVKFTAYFLYPAAALAVAGMLWRGRDRRTLVAVGALLGAGVALQLAWQLLGGVFEPAGAASLPSGTSVGGGQLALVRENPLSFVSYVWQVFVPVRFGFMADLYAVPWPAFDIFGVRGWGAFGWYSILFPDWVYVVIVVAMLAVAVLCAVTLVRRRGDAVRRRWIEIVVLLAVIAGVVVGLEMAFYAPAARPAVSEQGRYVFTALVPLVAVVAGACLAFGRRWAPVLAGALVVAALVLSLASQLLTLSTFYT